jgi:hypothetical protein
MMFFFVIAVSLLVISSNAFTLSRNKISLLSKTLLQRRMSNDFSRPDPVKVESVSKPEEEQPKTEEPEKPKPEISDEMRSRLRRELQSQGADPNFSRGPILGLHMNKKNKYYYHSYNPLLLKVILF